MRYKIDDCSVCGISNPVLVFRGWIESNASEFIIRDKQKKYHYEKFTKTRSKVYKIDIRIRLKKSYRIEEYELVAIVDGKEVVFHQFNSNPVKRLIQKNNLMNHSFFNKRIKNDYLGTLEMANDFDYHKWINKHEFFSPVIKNRYTPLISIVMPVYNVDSKYLEACIDSVLDQTYQNFELCIADDNSTNQSTIDTLKRYAEKDKRIKVVFRKENGHISLATNSALELATGEFIGLIDNDDFLVKHALNEVVTVLNENRELDLIYSDEDKIDLNGNRSDPHFKSDFALNTFYGGNYICHFTVIRKSIVDQIEGFRKGYEGAQDFDLFLRVSDKTNRIYHIPKILYHWRMIPGSTALDSKSKNYAGEAGKRALHDLFAKKGMDVHIDILVNTHYFVEFLLTDETRVDILIDCRNITNEFASKLSDMKCNLTYTNYKFILFGDKSTFANNNVNEYTIIEMRNSDDIEYINNLRDYVTSADAKYFLFLDSNYYIETFNAIELMIGYASQSTIGVVGCKVIDVGKQVIESGYFFDTDGKMFESMLPTYTNDYGFYGRLLIPVNYRAVENKCLLIGKDKFLSSFNFETEESFEYEIFSMQCQLHDDYQLLNVFLPQVEIIEVKKQIKKENVFHFKGNTEFDKYYNKNLSNLVAYRLPR